MTFAFLMRFAENLKLLIYLQLHRTLIKNFFLILKAHNSKNTGHSIAIIIKLIRVKKVN